MTKKSTETGLSNQVTIKDENGIVIGNGYFRIVGQNGRTEIDLFNIRTGKELEPGIYNLQLNDKWELVVVPKGKQ